MRSLSSSRTGPWPNSCRKTSGVADAGHWPRGREIIVDSTLEGLAEFIGRPQDRRPDLRKYRRGHTRRGPPARPRLAALFPASRLGPRRIRRLLMSIGPPAEPSAQPVASPEGSGLRSLASLAGDRALCSVLSSAAARTPQSLRPPVAGAEPAAWSRDARRSCGAAAPTLSTARRRITSRGRRARRYSRPNNGERFWREPTALFAASRAQ